MGSLIPRKVFVGGISEETSEADLKGVLGKFGSILDIRVITDKSMNAKSGEPRRFAFVEFASEEEVSGVIETFSRCELELHGRRLNVANAYRKTGTFGRVFTPSNPDASSPPAPAMTNTGYTFHNSHLLNPNRAPPMPSPFAPYFPPYFQQSGYPGYPYMPIGQPFPPPPPPVSPQHQMLYPPVFSGYGVSPPRENRLDVSPPYTGTCNGGMMMNGARGPRDRLTNYNVPPEMGCGHRMGAREPCANLSIPNQELLCHLNALTIQPSSYPEMSRPGMFMGNSVHSPSHMGQF